jgi:hypothetical protein
MVSAAMVSAAMVSAAMVSAMVRMNIGADDRGLGWVLGAEPSQRCAEGAGHQVEGQPAAAVPSLAHQLTRFVSTSSRDQKSLHCLCSPATAPAGTAGDC